MLLVIWLRADSGVVFGPIALPQHSKLLMGIFIHSQFAIPPQALLMAALELQAGESHKMLSFKLASIVSQNGQRLGTLAFCGRASIKTPNYIANASRGVVSHLTPDVCAAYTSINAVYMAFEDC
jgi:hypothetical protein